MKCAACNYEGDRYMDVVLKQGGIRSGFKYQPPVNPSVVPHDGTGIHVTNLIACPECGTVQVTWREPEQ